MPIDLSDRIIQPNRGTRVVKLHPWRRAVEVAVGACIVALPLCNALRADIRTGKIYLLGQSFGAQHLFFLVYCLLFFVIALMTVSLIYGRWWCGWTCPQTLLSDFGDSLRALIDRLFKTYRPVAWRRVASDCVWVLSMLLGGALTAASILAYVHDPRTVWHALVAPSADPEVALEIAVLAFVVTLDLLWVRRRFCARACPYGLFLSALGDRNTMTVRYLKERASDCIECGKCVKVCPMDIDIRNGPNQLECIACGECIDACNDVLPLTKDPKPGLIALTYGTAGARHTSQLPLLQRLGIWDMKRVALLALLVVVAGGLAAERFGHHETAVQIWPLGSISVAQEPSGPALEETYQMILTNGSSRDQDFRLTVDGLPGAQISDAHASGVVHILHSEQRVIPIVVSAPKDGLVPDRRYAIRVTATSIGRVPDSPVAMGPAVFYVPKEVQ